MNILIRIATSMMGFFLFSLLPLGHNRYRTILMGRTCGMAAGRDGLWAPS